MEVKKCPTKEEIANAIEIINDQSLHYYQLLYFNDFKKDKSGYFPLNPLTSAEGIPLKITRYSYGIQCTAFLKISYVDYENSKGLYFFVNDESDDVVLEKARMLIEGAKLEKVDRRACCVFAKKVFCVCEASFECPLHGRKCVGSHD